jgi:hypothetical protein
MVSPEARLHPDPYADASAVGRKKRRPWWGLLFIVLLVLCVVLLVTHKPKPQPDQNALDQPAVVTIKAATVRSPPSASTARSLEMSSPLTIARVRWCAKASR